MHIYVGFFPKCLTFRPNGILFPMTPSQPPITYIIKEKTYLPEIPFKIPMEKYSPTQHPRQEVPPSL